MMKPSEPYVHSVRQIHDIKKASLSYEPGGKPDSHFSPSLLEVFLFLVSFTIWYDDLDWHFFIFLMSRDIY